MLQLLCLVVLRPSLVQWMCLHCCLLDVTAACCGCADSQGGSLHCMSLYTRHPDGQALSSIVVLPLYVQLLSLNGSNLESPAMDAMAEMTAQNAYNVFSYMSMQVGGSAVTLLVTLPQVLDAVGVTETDCIQQFTTCTDSRSLTSN